MSNFRVGQKVVCVSVASLSAGWGGVEPWLKLGAIYEIRWIGKLPVPSQRKWGLGVRLVGIDRLCLNQDWDDYPFAASRFRPLVERKTDISIFTKILDEVNAKVPVARVKQLLGG